MATQYDVINDPPVAVNTAAATVGVAEWRPIRHGGNGAPSAADDQVVLPWQRFAHGDPGQHGTVAVAGENVELRLLGAVEAWEEDKQLDLGPRQQRFLLAVLALRVNRLVPVDRLVDLTWPDSPPHTARHAIHVSVSRLRAVLAHAGGDRNGVRIITRGPTYGLRADPMCIDAHRFRALVTEARTETDDAAKAAMLRRALDMWHGPPLADVAGPSTDQLVRGLEEARLSAMEEWLDAELRLGRHEAILDDLAESAEQHPYRQRLLARLMLALYRAGRAHDALVAYRRARSRLLDELGLDPGPHLQQLEQAILRGDPALEWPGPEPRRAPPP